MKTLLAIFSLCLFASAVHAQTPPWSGIIDPNRAIDWSAGQAGVSGGIPSGSWTQCGSTVAAGTSVTTINSLLAACSANTYLLLGPGTFNLASGILFTDISNVALRGSGANQTFLIFSSTSNCPIVGSYADVCISGGDLNYNVTPSNTANWTAGYSKGITTITVSSVTNLKVGWPIILDQFDESTTPSDFANNDIFVCGNNINVCSINGDNGDGHRNYTGPSVRAQQQNVTVTQCDGNSTFGHACASGANITISPGLYMPNWCPEGTPCATTQPGAWWPTLPAFNDGIENLSMDHSIETNQYAVGVLIYNCSGCWVSGVRSIQPGRSHVAPNFSPHTTIQNSYFYKTYATTSVSYGLDMNNSGDSLLLNNIFEFVTAAVDMNGNCSGCVVAYNYSVNNAYSDGMGNFTYLLDALAVHSEGCDTILFEGNQVNAITGDITHGTHNTVTLFRNAMNGYQQDNGVLPTNLIPAFLARSYNRYFNVIGNVLGNSYSLDYTYTAPGRPTIQSMGGSGGAVPNDSFTGPSAMLWANWDSVTGTRFCGPGAPGFSSPPCSSVSEVPSTITNWPNPVPANTTLPASFLYRSQPSWWPSSKPWPLQGPDVAGGNLGSCNGGTYAASYANSSSICTGAGGTFYTLAGHASSTPAMDCFLTTMGGSPIGTDSSALAFNPSACPGFSPGTVATPSCSPGSGTYGSTQSVTCMDSSGGAVMCYTTNGTTPATNGSTGCTTGTLYSTTISVSATETLKVIAGGTGYTDSSVVSYAYIITAGGAVPSGLSGGVKISGGAIVR